jgi:hypothetical protein
VRQVKVRPPTILYSFALRMNREFTFNFSKKLTFEIAEKSRRDRGKRHVLLLLPSLLFFMIVGSVKCQESFGSKPDLVFSNLYDFKILSADSIVSQEIGNQPDSALWNLLSANVAWVEILAGNLENEYWNDEFTARIKKAKRNLKQNGLEDDDKLFYYIIVHAFMTRHELLGENYLSAAADLNTCIDQISESFGREEKYEPFFLTSGLYYYFMAEAHEKYFLMRPYLAMYPDGDKELGLEYLNNLTSNEDVFLRNESNYFLMRIFFDLEKDFGKALVYATRLVSENENNLIFGLYRIKILQALESEEVANEINLYKERVLQNGQLSLNQKEHFIQELYK